MYHHLNMFKMITLLIPIAPSVWMASIPRQWFADLQSEDNLVRGRALEVFEDLLHRDPNTLARGMLEALVHHPDETTRSVIVASLRKLLGEWTNLSLEMQSHMMTVVSRQIVSEPSTSVQRLLVNLTRHIANVVETWPGIIEGALACLDMPERMEQAPAFLTMLARISETKLPWFAPFVHKISDIAFPLMAKHRALEIRKAAALCSCSILFDRLPEFGTLVLDVIEDMASADAPDVGEVMEEFFAAFERLDHSTIATGPFVPRIVVQYMTMIQKRSVDESVRIMALEQLNQIVVMFGPLLKDVRMLTTVADLMVCVISVVPEEGILGAEEFASWEFDEEANRQELKDMDPVAAGALKRWRRSCWRLI